MAAYLIRRLWQMIPTLLGVVLLVFLLFKFFGGDPAEILGGLNATPEQVQAIRDQLGLNQPWYVQLAHLPEGHRHASTGAELRDPRARSATSSRRACRRR